ncbi:hypothetical protein ACMFMG_006571 [Clarireedia jacksonii]
MSGPSSPTLEPAKPITADRLLELEEKQRKRFTGAGRAQRIRTGCREIDEYVLAAGKGKVPEMEKVRENDKGFGGVASGIGGFERGVVVGLSAAEGDAGEGRGARLTSLNVIASVLLFHLTHLNTLSISEGAVKPKVIVVDTTGSFPLSLLAKVLKSRLTNLKGEMQARNNTTEKHVGSTHFGVDEEENEQLSLMLGLVAISRVFDIEGLWEVLSEIGRTANQVNNDEINERHMGSSPWSEQPETDNREVQPHVRDEIGDSEDDDSPLQSPSPPPEPASTSHTTSIDTAPELLIIDNMHHLISHLFTHSEKNSAHNLLSLLSKTIHTLTHTQNLLTILHNSTISAKTNYSNSAPPTIQSIFTPSTHLKPSLGRIFDQFVDLHVMISKVPKFREDAEMAYAGAAADQVEIREGGGSSKVNECLIFEVLRDECPVSEEDREAGRKFADREEKWGCFEIGTDGLELRDAFKKGVSSVGDVGSGGGDGRGGEHDVGSVVRLYGFGGRRV